MLDWKPKNKSGFEGELVKNGAWRGLMCSGRLVPSLGRGSKKRLRPPLSFRFDLGTSGSSWSADLWQEAGAMGWSIREPPGGARPFKGFTTKESISKWNLRCSGSRGGRAKWESCAPLSVWTLWPCSALIKAIWDGQGRLRWGCGDS